MKSCYKDSVKRFLALTLVTVMSVTSALGTSLADALEEKPSEEKLNSKQVEVNSHYINGVTGNNLADSEVYREDRDKQPPLDYIEGYEYQSYAEDVTHIYVPKSIPYIIGYPDKTVRPLRYLSRAEAMTIFYRLYDKEYPDEVKKYSDGDFTDLKKDAWFYNEVTQLYKSGIVEGENNKLYPNRPITRAELAALATRFNPDKFSYEKSKKEKKDSPFLDVDESKWYSDAIEIAESNGWLSGYPDGTFKPDKNITRTETMAIINRVLDREITTERLKELGVKNPYIDIDEENWAYADAMEATIPHKVEDWHGLKYDDYNIVIERFIDKDGNTLHEDIVSKGKKEKEPRAFVSQEYLGYIRVYTYMYDKGVPKPELTKTNNVPESGGINPGDIVTYTLTAVNSSEATGRIVNAYITDVIPENTELVRGSVAIDNKTVDYEYDEKTRELKIPFNVDDEKDMLQNTMYEFTFSVKVSDDAYNVSIKNTAYLKGDNVEDVEASDEGFTTNEGRAILDIDKSVDKTEAKVGDTLTYTVDVTNTKDSDTTAKEVFVTDKLEDGLDFTGFVTVDGKNHDDYTYDEANRLLKVNLGNIEKEATKKIVFKAVINKTAYAKALENTAVAEGKNAEPVDDSSEQVIVADGTAELDIKKVPNKTEVKVRDEIVYNIEVTSSKNSEVTAKNVVVSDVIPKHLTFKGMVELDGESASYQYDDKSKLLTVKLGGLKPGEKKNVTVHAIVNDNAYGKKIKNTAKVTSDNANPKEADSEVINVEKGKSDGRVSEKVPNKTKVKVGDTVTYTIKLSNAKSATAEWKPVEIVDKIPEGMTFKGNVQLDKKASDKYSYDESTKTLKLLPEKVDIGESITYTFDVTIDKGTEGETIVNVATLVDENGEQPIPSTPVNVEGGEPKPYVVKTHSADKVSELDTFEYKIEVTNKDGKNSALWKNVVLTDVLPPEVKLQGSVMVDNKTVQIINSGNEFSVMLGDIKPGDTRVVTYEVMVKEGVAAETKKEIQNVVEAVGQNGSAGATDKGVIINPIPKPEPEEPKPGEDDENKPEEPKEMKAKKLTEKTVIDLKADPNNEYSFELVNETDKDWVNVKIEDTLYTSKLHLYKDSVRVNGRLLEFGTGFNYKANNNLVDVITIPVGTIKAGSKAVVSFKVRFENDAAGEPNYINRASVTSDSDPALPVEAPAVTFVNEGNVTGTHLPLFQGYPDGTWRPTYNPSDPVKGRGMVTIHEVTAVMIRSLTDKQLEKLIEQHGGTDGLNALPPKVQQQWDSVQIMTLIGGITPKETDLDQLQEGTDWEMYQGPEGSAPRIVATRAQMGRMLNAVGLPGATGKSYSNEDPMVRTSRYDFAKEMCDILNRDVNPNTNGLPINSFSDIHTQSGAIKGLVNQVSNYHNYVLDNQGNETWIMTDLNFKPKF